jgi:hypothetical protein
MLMLSKMIPLVINASRTTDDGESEDGYKTEDALKLPLGQIYRTRELCVAAFVGQMDRLVDHLCEPAPLLEELLLKNLPGFDDDILNQSLLNCMVPMLRLHHIGFHHWQTVFFASRSTNVSL